MHAQSAAIVRRAHPVRPAGRGAFSLIELTLVIATVAVLSAIAIPRYSNSLARYQVDLAAKRLAADLMLARSNARTTSTAQIVDFAAPADGYTLTGMPAPDGHAGDYAVRLSDEPYRAALGPALFGDPPVAWVRFDRYGMPDKGGTVVVRAGAFQKTVVLDPVNGKTEVR